VPLFDSAFLKKLEYLSLVSRRVFRGQILAQRRTLQMGGGIEFADHRGYNPGDDFRYLDWNLYARHDALLLKRFQEEEDLHVYLLLDCSASMGAGAGAKFDLARQLTAALAYIALADLDRVAVVAFGGQIVADFPLTRGKGRILTLLRFLEDLQSQSTATDLTRAAGAFVHRSQRQGLVLVVSDLFDPRGYRAGLDLLRYRRYETHLIHVYDPGEADPGLLGDVELVDIETGAGRKVTVTERARRQHRRLFAEFLETAQHYCRAYSLGYTLASTEVAFDELVLQMMRRAGALT
jgi:uncharacterized protein (DUF58 family)